MKKTPNARQMTLQRSKSRMLRCGTLFWSLVKIYRPFCFAGWEVAKKLRMCCSAFQFEPWNGHRIYGTSVPCADGLVESWPA